MHLWMQYNIEAIPQLLFAIYNQPSSGRWEPNSVRYQNKESVD